MDLKLAAIHVTSTFLIYDLSDLGHAKANTLLEIVERRYRKGGIIITSQVSPDSWKGLFDDPVISEAITDRLKNPSDLVELSGDSYRMKLEQN